MMKRFFALLATGLIAMAGTAQAASDADVENSLSPYKNFSYDTTKIKPGMVINKDNVEKVKEYLDPAMYQFIQKGWYEIPVMETTSFDLPAPYVEATKKNLNKTKLVEGNLVDYLAGRPFVQEPDANDPQAGTKLAFNNKYALIAGDGGTIYPFYWKYRDMNSGKIERQIKFEVHSLNFKHRTTQEPIPNVEPNPSDIFRGLYLRVEEPFDVENTQLLIQRHEDDLKRDNAWLYLGFQRRVRRLSSGQTTDAFLGSDLMIEDFEGYNNRVADQKWTYKGTEKLLLPYYNHNELPELSDEFKEPDGYRYVDFGGQGGCFPKVNWQVRKVYVIEAVPVDPNHPISKRIMYMDAQTGFFSRTISYDRAGKLWKTWLIGESHPDHHLEINKGSNVAQWDSFTMIDTQAMHCTTGQFHAHNNPDDVSPNQFTPQYLRKRGQ
ncbi:DUF1329 domain-containing protein [Desulfuromonas sp. TF]|uniref:DUF1329 domain-containing protein n=1 Tax=Desulfuromonas sp. TF TaxID=1232410 RepID=UPI00040121C5|nr:DUF1329 domain-containing protein [Desulfuromonas sp. TF]